MLATQGGHSVESWTELLIKLKSKEFNSIYSSYLELSKKFPEQTTIVRYEDVIADPESFLNELSERLQLTANLPTYADITGLAVPSHWDEAASKENLGIKFSKEYYLKQKLIGN
jgi:hypothetical protein